MGSMRYILGMILAAVLLVSGTLAYLQSAGGFARILVPLIEDRLGGTLEVHSGRVRLDGSLEVEQVRYADADAGVLLTAERLVVLVAPASLFSERTHIVALEVQAGLLHIDRSKADRKGKRSEASSRRRRSRFNLRLPFEIDRADVRDFTIEVSYTADSSTEVGPLELQLHNLGAGREARFEFISPIRTAAGADAAAYSGASRLSGSVEFDGAAQLRAWQVAGDLETDGDAGGSLQASLESRGVESEGIVDAAARISGWRSDEALGEIEASLRASISRDGPARTADPVPFRLAVDVRAISAQLLAPLTVALAQTDLRGGPIEGSLRVEPGVERDTLAVRVDLDGRDLALVRNGLSGPSVRIRLAEDAVWYPGPARLDLNSASVSVTQSGVEMIAAKLLEPASLTFAAEPAGDAVDVPHTALRVRIRDLEMAAAGQWLALAAVEVPDVLATSVLEGDIRFGIDSSGSAVAFDGKLAADDLLRGVDGAPLKSVTGLRGTIVPGRGADFEHIDFHLVEAGAPLVSARAEGSVNWAPVGISLAVDGDVSDASLALRHLGVLSGSAVRGGRLRWRGELSQLNGALVAAADVAVESLSVDVLDGAIERDLSGKVMLRLLDQTLHIDSVNLGVAPVGATGGATCNVSGEVALGSGTPADIAVGCADFELTPWIELLGGRGWSALGPTPLDLNVTLRAGEDGAVRLAGEQKLVLRDENGGSFSVSARSEIRPADAGTEFDLDLRSTRSPPDRVRIRGAVRPGERRRLHVDAAIEQLDLGPYRSVRAARRTQASVGAVPSGASMRELRAGALPRLPLDVDADVTIGRIRYGPLRIESGKLKARLLQSRWQIESTPMSFAGGVVSARFDRQIEASGETVAAKLRLAGVGLTELSESLRDESNPTRFDGTLDLDADLRGAASLEQDMLDALGGSMQAKVRRGRVRGFSPMRYLAEQTGVRQIALIPLDWFDADGGAVIDRGVARLKGTKVRSAAANFDVDGEVTLDGNLDLTLCTKVGSGVARQLEGLGLVQRLVGRVEDLVALPLQIRIRGPIGNVRYSAVPAAPDVVEGVGGIVGEAVEGVGELIEGVRGLLHRRRRR